MSIGTISLFHGIKYYRSGYYFELLKGNEGLSAKEVYERIAVQTSYATLKRVLTRLVEQN